MKKLFGGKGKNAAASGPLCGHLVQVGAWQVRCEALLGSGGYADIYRVTDITSDKTYALKHLRLNKDKEIIAEVQHEARTQAKLKNHPNILRLHAVSFAGPKGSETDGFFLLDYCPGTLLDLLQRQNFQLEERTVFHIFHCACQALAHMHSQSPPMAHRDLKAENVLMLPNGTWVLCDFGSSTSRAAVYDTPEAMAAEEEVVRKHTTPAYRPPEMWDLYQRQLIDTKVDIWALGVLLFVLCFGRLPFAGDSKLQILNNKYEMPPTRPPQLRALIKTLLTLNPADRPDINQTLQQLNQAAVAVLGQSLKAPALQANRQAATAAAAATPPGQRQQQQPHQEPPAAVISSSGSFWSTADALGTQGQQQAAAAAVAPASGSSGAGNTQQQQLPQDWARFSSSGGAASSQLQSHASHSSSQGSPESRAAPGGMPAAAAAATTASSSSAGSTVSGGRVPVAAQSSSAAPADVSASPVTTANGYYPSIPGHGFGNSSGGNAGSSSDEQERHAQDMQRLAHITARAQAAAAAAVAGKRIAPVPPPQQQHQREAVTDPPLLLERRSQPYFSCVGASSASVTPSAAVAAADPSRPSASHGGAVSSSNGNLLASRRPGAGDSGSSSNSRLGTASGSSAATAAPSGSPALAVPGSEAAALHSVARHSSGSRAAPVSESQAPLKEAVAAAGNHGQVKDGSVDQLGLDELRAAVFGEMDMLRAQVRSLSDQNQAFVFRIKQLESYAQRQETAVAKLQEQVAGLQQSSCSAHAYPGHQVGSSGTSALHGAHTP